LLGACQREVIDRLAGAFDGPEMGARATGLAAVVVPAETVAPAAPLAAVAVQQDFVAVVIAEVGHVVEVGRLGTDQGAVVLGAFVRPGVAFAVAEPDLSLSHFRHG
jgi:hypothetical protein